MKKRILLIINRETKGNICKTYNLKLSLKLTFLTLFYMQNYMHPKRLKKFFSRFLFDVKIFTRSEKKKSSFFIDSFDLNVLQLFFTTIILFHSIKIIYIIENQYYKEIFCWEMRKEEWGTPADFRISPLIPVQKRIKENSSLNIPVYQPISYKCCAAKHLWIRRLSTNIYNTISDWYLALKSQLCHDCHDSVLSIVWALVCASFFDNSNYPFFRHDFYNLNI